jgi:dihydrofolate reductase
MGRLIYSAITSFDGYTVDADGKFDWSAPDEQVHAFVNDLERPIGTYLYGRRMYDVMKVWQTMGDEPDQRPVSYDYARIWRAAAKIVFSRTLDVPATPRTAIERDFDVDSVRALVAGAEHDVSVGGATLAAQALRAGLVHEIQQFLSPVIVGGGTPFLPGGIRLDLSLADERRFDNGVVYLRYTVA